MKTRYIDVLFSSKGLQLTDVSLNKTANTPNDAQNELHSDFIVEVATASDIWSINEICEVTLESAKTRGTGISGRSPKSLAEKMINGDAIIAYTKEGVWAGFSFISSWEEGRYVSNSGLIVGPQFRHTGLAKKIKERIFELSRKKYPDAFIFSLTSGLAVMKMNYGLGFEPVTYAELTTDDNFWESCKSCVNCPVLESKGRKNCLCTAMRFDPHKS